MPLSTNVESSLLSLTIGSAGYYCKREKISLLTVNIVRNSSTASWIFFPTKGSSFIRVLEQTHFFPFYEKSKERVGRASHYCCLSKGDSYDGIGLGCEGEGERLRYKMILRLRTHFNYERNHQVTRGRSAYDLKGTQPNPTKTSALMARNLKL